MKLTMRNGSTIVTRSSKRQLERLRGVEEGAITQARMLELCDEALEILGPETDEERELWRAH